MTKNRILTIGVFIGLLMTLGWIIYAITQAQYIEAVAASCIGPVLAWFALGAGKSNDE